jgi:hypothetical protein
MDKPKRLAKCHPELKHYAKDLCAKCYRNSDKMKQFYESYRKSEKRKEVRRKYIESEKGKATTKRYNELNCHTEEYKAYQREYHRLPKVKEYHINYQRERTRNDPQYKLAKSLRSRLGIAIRGNFKSGSAVQDLGCSIEFLAQYLESKFQSGMSWDNHGEWHIDHIKPLASFDLTIREELLKACHYTNLQPLWAVDNLKKHTKLLDF